MLGTLTKKYCRTQQKQTTTKTNYNKQQKQTTMSHWSPQTYEKPAVNLDRSSLSQWSPQTYEKPAVNLGRRTMTEKTCQQVANQQGFEIGGNGYDFSGNYSTKGCYGYVTGNYQNMAFFGKGSGDPSSELSGSKIRIKNDATTTITTKQECEQVAKQQGFEIGGNGYNFSGNYSTKGCYGYVTGNYQNMAFFGTGGNESEQRKRLTGSKIRIQKNDDVVHSPECSQKKTLASKAKKEGSTAKYNNAIKDWQACQRKGIYGEHPILDSSYMNWGYERFKY